MKPLLLALGIGVALGACGAQVITTSDASVGDAATDAPTTTVTPTTTTTTTTPPPTCPMYRPIRDIPCTVGLSCFYPCAPGETTSTRATCPSGRWVLETVSGC
jgi:hypothetical protein